jgi:hypothetical protein
MARTQAAPRTVVTMVEAGPEGTVFGVYRATVRNPDQRWTWNANHAQRIGSVIVKRGDTRPSYRAMAERFATDAWPALNYPTEL